MTEEKLRSGWQDYYFSGMQDAKCLLTWMRTISRRKNRRAPTAGLSVGARLVKKILVITIYGNRKFIFCSSWLGDAEGERECLHLSLS